MKETFEYQGCTVSIEPEKHKIEIYEKKNKKNYTIYNDNNANDMYEILLNLKRMIVRTKSDHNEGFFPQNPIAKVFNRIKK